MSDDAELGQPPKTSGPRIPADVATFVEGLAGLQKRGDLAILRRNAGRTLSDAGQIPGLFYRLLPAKAYWNEEIYFLVATLFPLNTRGHSGDFGATMRDIRSRTKSEAVDRRMGILLDSDFDRVDDKIGGGSLSYRLRQMVKFAESRQVGVHWGRLLADLLYWTNPEKRVQKRWARSYYQSAGIETHSDSAEGGHL